MLEYKRMVKAIPEKIIFRKGKISKSYPRPLNAFKNSYWVSDVLDVATNQVVCFAYKQSSSLVDSKFYAYWGLRNSKNELIPLMNFHYHPSHKGIHARFACKTTELFTSRYLVVAPELNLHKKHQPDIRTQEGINELICLFCKSAGIELPKENFPNQLSLFSS